MKERIVVTIAVSLLAAVAAAVVGGTDGIYIIASILFFGVCAAYAEWCERL
jgi:preprotein translocase subunit SecF